MNCKMKDYLWSDVASPRAIAAWMERGKTLGSYPDSGPMWHQAAAAIMSARVEQLHGMVLAISPVYMEGRYSGGNVGGETKEGPTLRCRSLSRELGLAWAVLISVDPPTMYPS